MTDQKESSTYSNTEVPDEYLDEVTLPKYKDRVKINPIKITNAHGGHHAEWYLDDGKSKIGDRRVGVVFKDLYTKFGVSEAKGEDDDDSKKKKKKPKKDGESKKESKSDDKDEKNYGVNFPVKRNPKLTPVCDTLDECSIREYSLHGEKLGPNGKPISKETAESALRPTARPFEKTPQNNARYGPNFKWKVDRNTQYYIKRADGLTDDATRADVNGKEGIVTIMGYIHKLNLGGRISVGCVIEHYLIQFISKDPGKFKSFLNPAPKNMPAAESPASTTATSTSTSSSSTSTPATSTPEGASSSSPKVEDPKKNPLGVTGKRKFVKDKEDEDEDEGEDSD